MKENKLVELSMDFSVDIINLVEPQRKTQNEIITKGFGIHIHDRYGAL